MNIKDFNNLYGKVMEEHSWKNLYKVRKSDKRDIKYVDLSIDTRTGDIWKVKFRGLVEDKEFYGNNMKEDIKEWLNEKV